MREIKFRVWDELANEWDFCTGGCHFCLRPNEDLVSHGRVFQQYTGLKDKEGREIYEGDILDQVWDNKPCYYLVEWDNFSEYCGFGLRAINKRDGTFRMTIHDFKSYLSEGFVIIGNKFETPELLKQ